MQMVRALFVNLSLIFLFSARVSASAHERIPAVVVTTTAIESIVREIAGDDLVVRSIIPSGSCPGHFDLRPAEVVAIARAQLFITHSFEKENFLKKFAARTGHDQDTILVSVDVKGSWMVPDVYLDAIGKVTVILSERFPFAAQRFVERAGVYGKAIEAEASLIRERAEALRGQRFLVVADEMQKDFMFWLGAEVLAVYARPDELSIKELRNLIDSVRSYSIDIVVDNLQSSAGAGKPIADELGAVHIVLSNFPGIYNDKPSYILTLRENAAKVFEAAGGESHE
jgi:zinc transport system substrate-binding protein